jgi:hypothetical protein
MRFLGAAQYNIEVWNPKKAQTLSFGEKIDQV